MRFRGFLSCPDPFLKCQRFVNLAVHFIRARSSLILHGSRNVDISRMDLDTKETYETHNLYIERTRGSLKNIKTDFCQCNYLLLEPDHRIYNSEEKYLLRDALSSIPLQSR